MMRTVALTALWSALAAVCGQAQMIDPAIDRDDEPFCYFSQPTDVIGVMDGKEGTLISPEGYLYTGFGELMFFTGNPPVPVRRRVKTLERGYLPIVHYSFDTEGIAYAVTAFAATLDGNPESPLMNFVRVRVVNPTPVRRTAYIAAAIRFQNDANTNWGVGDNRFGRPAKAERTGNYEQAGVQFSTDWEYSFSGDAVLRDGKVMYLFAQSPAPERMLTLKTGYNESPSTSPEKLFILPTTPAGIAMYTLRLEAGREAVLDFKMPYEPFPHDSPLTDALRAARFETFHDRTVEFWKKIISEGISIELPESKAVNTFKASLVYDLIARNKHDQWYVQKVNEFQYDAFWLRDASFIVRMYDLGGYHEIARQCLAFFLQWQQPDGNFLSQGGQYDGWGQTLWAFGQHYRITRDQEFAESVYPAVVKAVAWLQQARRSDPFRLMPATTPGDNEDISGHVTGHNFIALGGLKNAIALAEGVANAADAKAFRAEYDDYLEALLERLRTVTAKTGGYMPPGLDSLGGQDWGNMESVYPEMILDSFDPMVSATLAATRAKYQEGIMTYGNGRWLHHYLTMANTETEVVRGEQRSAIEELYALLVHTSATHAGFEFSVLPWKTRDFGMNLAPHGWFAAKYRALLRNMLVREQGNALHLFSALSPSWVGNGLTVAVRRAPTNFGVLDAELTSGVGNAEIRLRASYVRPPDSLILHLPWFMQVAAVTADGTAMRVTGSSVALPPATKAVAITWKRAKDAPVLTYDGAVKSYRAEYHRRYGEFLKQGN
ncbi:MAG: hypothetical protein AB1428_09445 [Bacteroidota bacterium]